MDWIIPVTLVRNGNGWDDLKRRIGVFQNMGEEFASADSAPREGPFGQLKAFYGLQSGSGYEDILLNEED